MVILAGAKTDLNILWFHQNSRVLDRLTDFFVVAGSHCSPDRHFNMQTFVQKATKIIHKRSHVLCRLFGNLITFL